MPSGFLFYVAKCGQSAAAFPCKRALCVRWISFSLNQSSSFLEIAQDATVNNIRLARRGVRNVHTKRYSLTSLTAQWVNLATFWVKYTLTKELEARLK